MRESSQSNLEDSLGTPRNKPGAEKQLTSGRTNKNLNKTQRTKPISNALPEAKPTTKRSPNVSAATDPATMKNAPRVPAIPTFTTAKTKAVPTRTTKRRPSTQ